MDASLSLSLCHPHSLSSTFFFSSFPFPINAREVRSRLFTKAEDWLGSGESVPLFWGTSSSSWSRHPEPSKA
ncbi:hypothetical protein BDV24DRAFT_128392 [Aspergillus arachidicola]|uniref:Uncharacterized protein n=1 Tax=Aspergillus arachidicola TaxID=656916 RepID=A0A5N6YH78_9EURO|nr:hypothetical protein BDV24DRAFT_128392 [Aspergillus arachidicola]